MTSLTQTAGHKMAALTVMFSQLSTVDFQQRGPKIEWKTAPRLLYTPFLVLRSVMRLHFDSPLTTLLSVSYIYICTNNIHKHKNTQAHTRIYVHTHILFCTLCHACKLGIVNFHMLVIVCSNYLNQLTGLLPTHFAVKSFQLCTCKHVCHVMFLSS